MKVSWLWLACVLVFLAAPAFAQVPVNPGRVELKADDLPIATRVEIGVFLLGAAAPVSVLDIGKPTPRPDGLIEAPVNVRPFGLGSYEFKARVVAGTAVSAWQAGGADGKTPVPFDRALSSPVLLRALP
jgi:hypothetical protein